MNALDRKVIGVMRQDYDLCDGALQARIDAERDRYLASVGARNAFRKTRRPMRKSRFATYVNVVS